MVYVTAYLAALVVFLAVDAVWLMVMGPALYRPVLGDILLPSIRLAPAIVFYLLFPIGIVVFAIIPSLRENSLVGAIGLAALFGLIAYATYDLTNFATLRNWTLQLTVLDMVYGAVAAGVAAGAGYTAAAYIRG